MGINKRLLRPGHFRFSLWHLAISLAVAGGLLAYFQTSLGGGARPTGRELDVAIFGRGYFQVMGESGVTRYTRRGRFFINGNGRLAIGTPSDFWLVCPSICLPSDWEVIDIARDGEVLARKHGSMPRSVGVFQLAKFNCEDGLREVFPGIYQETDASGLPVISTPGNDGTGLLRQGWVESPLTNNIPWQTVIITAVCLLAMYNLLELRSMRMLMETVLNDRSAEATRSAWVGGAAAGSSCENTKQRRCVDTTSVPHRHLCSAVYSPHEIESAKRIARRWRSRCLVCFVPDGARPLHSNLVPVLGFRGVSHLGGVLSRSCTVFLGWSRLYAGVHVTSWGLASRVALSTEF